MKKKKILITAIIVMILVACCWKPLRLDRFYLGSGRIDWVDIVQVEGIHYQSNDTSPIVNETEIDKQIGVVKFTLEDNVSNPNYKMRNWDATHLKVKTKLFTIKGEENSIASFVDNSYHRYTK